MCVHYIEAEVEREPTADLHLRIEQTLARAGEPLRWAVVDAPEDGPVRVEATVVR
jgi:hypothetical protein